MTRNVALGELTPGQHRFVDAVADAGLTDQFYLSGGTALSAFHLHHRRSDDLDFFSRAPFAPAPVVALVRSVSEKEPIPHRIGHRLGFIVVVRSEPLKVEFVHYDFEHLEAPLPRLGALRVDGLRDILANKLSAIVEREEPKDYADLYFLLHQSELDLESGMADCATKFGWPRLDYLLQTALLRKASHRGWPETEPPVEPSEARRYFEELARSLVRIEPD